MFGPPHPPPVPWGSHPGQSNITTPAHEPFIKLYVNAVYYPNWRVYRNETPATLNPDILSHVYYAFASLSPDGVVFLGDEQADIKLDVDGVKGCIAALTQLKQRNRHLKVLLSIGGGGNGSLNFARVAAKNSTRDKFAQTARDLVRTHGLDGIDIDWEVPENPEQGSHYVKLLEAVREYLPSPRFVVSSALPAGEWALKNIVLPSAHPLLDYVNLMAYDFSGKWVDAAGHHAQLFTPPRPHNDASKVSCHSAVAYLRSKGVPAHKIILGIPAYGQSFLGARGVGDNFHGNGGDEGTFEYKALPRPGAQEFTDTAVGAAFCLGGDGGFVTYDNPTTVKMKADYVKNHGLGGVFFWTGTADGQGNRSLVMTSYCALHGTR